MERGAKRVFGVAGFSGAGKTTLLEKLIARFVAQGLTVAVIKQTHHDFDLDQPGKDSWRHRAAGASEVLLASDRRWALMHEVRGSAPPTLKEQVARLSPCDLVLLEGYKREPVPKLEVHRPALGAPLLYPEDPHILALASDEPVTTTLPWFALNDVPAIADFILQHARPI
jgi:molybdopterin-guanine dinucleotide biosynthesis protein B